MRAGRTTRTKATGIALDPPRADTPVVNGRVGADAVSRLSPAVDRRTPAHLEPGSSTAYERTVSYRLAKLTRHGMLHGRWLDCGCADGGYTVALAAAGASSVVGVDADEDRILAARARPHPATVRFERASAERLPLPDAGFDGVLVNEVLEHVADEHRALAEIRRVLRPGGHLALFGPNRWFPFEGHGARLGRRRTLEFPVPLLPWLPARVTRRVMRARNYWPHQLLALVRRQGFDVVAMQWAFPQFEAFPWLPEGITERYRELIPALERMPVVRRLGVSTFIVARRPWRP